MSKPFFIGESDFRVWLPDIEFIEKAGNDAFNSRRIAGVMSTSRRDRQGEDVLAKGLDFADFLKHGHFNDNHSQETSAIIGYPEVATYHKDLGNLDKSLKGVEGWACEGYLLKGTKRAEGIWELAKALAAVPNKKLGFSIEGKVVRRANKTIEKANIRNVAITNCFPGDTNVTGATNKVTRRQYSGEMIEINLATGEKLTGTPNHPIFTQRGWVSLGELDEINDRVGRFDVDLAKSASLSKIAHDVDNVPTTLEQVFNASLVSGNTLWVNKARKGNFHGDGAGSDVDVVLAKGFLRDRLASVFHQKFGKDALPAADKELPGLFGLGLFLKLAHARFLASTSLVGSFGKQLSLAGAPLGIFEPVRFLNVSADAISKSHVANGNSGHSVFGGDKGRRLAPSIGFSNISLKRRFKFSGHVFNLDTTQGWYEANGIVAHNCPVNTDCTWSLLAKSMEDEEVAMKSMMAGSAVSPATQTGGGALRTEDLEKKKEPHDVMAQKKKEDALKRSLGFDDLVKAMELIQERRSDFDDDAAAALICHLFKKGGKL